MVNLRMDRIAVREGQDPSPILRLGYTLSSASVGHGRLLALGKFACSDTRLGRESAAAGGAQLSIRER